MYTCKYPYTVGLCCSVHVMFWIRVRVVA